MSELATHHDTARPDGAAALLRDTATIRERAAGLLARARGGESRWFTVDDAALAVAAERVAAVTAARFPDLRVPFHSRWRHFEAGGVDRATGLDARAMTDLAVVSVLLDAGAGPDWSYTETSTGQRLSRSEGLGVASVHAFRAGLFSSVPADPLRADAAGLLAVDAGALASAFQVTASNPLVGLSGRVEVLHRLGRALSRCPDVFPSPGRPSGLLDAVPTEGGVVTARAVLDAVLVSFQTIWPAGNSLADEPLGDCWHHPAVPGPGLTAGWMPFHKLSQWLTYSLLEPFAAAGLTVTDLDGLTGLPEYRNGGLLLDTGVLTLRDPESGSRSWAVGDELVVEWRALTVALLDELAPLVRAALGVDASAMPLACVLEGGTWAAGRESAYQLRGGLPPLTITSDGTVF